MIIYLKYLILRSLPNLSTGIIPAHVGESQRERRRFGLAALRSLGMGKSRLVENMVAVLAQDNVANHW